MSLPEISTLLPQQPPMRLLDAVLSCNATALWAAVTPTTAALFAGPNGVPACIGLEYLAQACAAFFTLQASAAQAPVGQPEADKPEAGKPNMIKPEPTKPKEGMLIASRRFTSKAALFTFEQRLLLRVTLTSTLRPDSAGPGLVKFRGEIFVPSVTLPTQPNSAQLAELALTEAVTAADLSVYL